MASIQSLTEGLWQAEVQTCAWRGRARVSVVARCPAVSSANGLRGLASPSPPPVIVRRGPRGVAAQVPPASKPEHGGHPLQRLARGHPRLLPAPPGFHFQQQLLRQYRVPRGSHSPPPRSPQG
ncbi:pancreatic progenitor cell differentiation and proliferation factor isoform X3 [Macaca mulatta]